MSPSLSSFAEPHYLLILLPLLPPLHPGLSVMVKDVLATDGVQEAQAAPDGTDGDAGPINAHGRAGRRLAQSPAWMVGTQVGRGERKDRHHR